MAIDTVKLTSPSINEGLAVTLENLSILKQGIECASGEILYEITSGQLDGSYDSRVSFRICREEYRVNRGGRPELYPCDPFIELECSWAKFLYGQNVYGNPTSFRTTAGLVIDLLGELFGVELPHADRWQVHRVDWSEMFRLHPEAIAEFFRAIKNVNFPRRKGKAAKFAAAVYFPGSSTTLKLYHKGPEFKAHDWFRIKQALTRYRFAKFDSHFHYDTNYAWVEKKLKALQRLADNRLRAECEIHRDKLAYDWDGRLPFVYEMTDEYLKRVFDSEMFKLLKEGASDMETVRDYESVRNRLITVYSARSAKSLLAFYMHMASAGEDQTKVLYSQTRFYANRKLLVEAGVSWHQTNIYVLPLQGALPADFKPFTNDPRRCIARVRADSYFGIGPVLYKQALAAAA